MKFTHNIVYTCLNYVIKQEIAVYFHLSKFKLELKSWKIIYKEKSNISNTIFTLSYSITITNGK